MLRSKSNKPTELKSSREIALMREAGKLVSRALKICRSMATPGTTTGEIDASVEALYAEHDATPLFKGYPGNKTPFPAVTCISVNEQVVHGIPGPRALREGDMVTFDTACRLNGWCADAAITVPVGEVRPAWLKLLQTAEEILQLAIDELTKCSMWGEVARKMQKHAEKAGYNMVEKYVGHGIGRVMHENPQVPNYYERNPRKRHDFRLEPGLVLAVEPMVNMGKADTLTLKDHWTVVTKDGLPSVHVEHTLALTGSGVQIVTEPEPEDS